MVSMDIYVTMAGAISGPVIEAGARKAGVSQPIAGPIDAAEATQLAVGVVLIGAGMFKSKLHLLGAAGWGMLAYWLANQIGKPLAAKVSA